MHFFIVAKTFLDFSPKCSSNLMIRKPWIFKNRFENIDLDLQIFTCIIHIIHIFMRILQFDSLLLG